MPAKGGGKKKGSGGKKLNKSSGGDVTEEKKRDGGAADLPPVAAEEYEKMLDEAFAIESKRDFLKPDQSCFVPYPKDQGPFWTTDPAGTRPLRLAEKGLGSLPPRTVWHNFKRAVERQGDQVALRVERDGQWVEWTWREYYEQTRQAARALMQCGFEAHDSVNVIGFNSPEWFLSNMGAIAAGGKAAGIYTTNQTEACKYITEHSEARVVVVENEKQLNKFLPIRAELTKVKAYVMYAEEPPAGINEGKNKSLPPVYSWKEFMALADEVPEADLDARMDAQRASDACTLIYTSGTTGQPKAVMISHDNITWTAQSMFSLMSPDTFGRTEEHVISYLPLSHIAAQMLDIHMPIAIAACRGGNCTVHFARPDALKGSLGITLKAARPTLFFGVPRVWEKMALKMQAIGKETKGVKKTLATWAKSKGAEAYEEAQYGKSHARPWGFFMANTLVLKKVKAALGLSRCSLCLTGAAPIQADTLRYFGALGLEIYELYGMSESSGPQNVSFPGHFVVGACGPALPGCELWFDHDDARDREGEGEICYRGRHIMMGYMKNEEKTREAIDENGWLHSGDVGRLDENGFLKITGRIKELIITAGGENIAPVPMEDMVKSKCPAIKNIMMIGDKKKFCSAIITLHLGGSEEEGFTDQLEGNSAELDPEAKTVEDARNSEAFTAHIQAGVDFANENAEKNASKIQKWVILDTDFSIKNNEMTSTLKLKRSVIHEHFASEIESMYEDKPASITTSSGKKKSQKGKAKAEDAPAEKKTVAKDDGAKEEASPAKPSKKKSSKRRSVSAAPAQ